MVRRIIKASSNDVYIEIPDDYIGKTLEVLAFTLEEATNSFKGNYMDAINELYDDIRVDFNNFIFDRDEANSR